MKRKRILLLLCLILLLSYLTACSEFRYPRYNIEPWEDGYKLTITKDEAYMTRDDAEWYPNTRGKDSFDLVFGKCDKGYISTTSSKHCLLVDAHRGIQPFFVFLEDFSFTPVAVEYIKEAAFTAYGDEGFGEYDKGPTIDVTNNIENILELYKNGEKYVYKNFDYTHIIGDITLRNKEDSGLFHRIPIYFDGTHYYLLKNKKYIMCDEIIPENINILKEYKDSIFNK